MRTPLTLAICLVCACSSRGDPPSRTAAPAQEAPRTPHVTEHPGIGDVSFLSPQLQRAFDPAIDFVPMPAVPQPGDWRAAHPEEPQSFDDFMRASTRVPDATRRILYLLPLGDFPAEAPPLPALARVVAAFYTLEVRTLPAVPLADVKATARINDGTRKRQLLAPDVLRWMVPRVPGDAFALIAVTMEDLYPDPKWNFVFGQASLAERVGVQSFARQDPAFFGPSPGTEGRGPDRQKLALRRAVWTMVHEIAHTFGLHHCPYFECVVAGSNHQAESDRRPLHVCPVCGRKLQAVLEFDPAAREEELAKVLAEIGIDDEAAWSARRARWIRDGTR
ncbi:MAG: hypothetical protein KF773_14355 [Deltaproteobacteria bacterium]|nr:hypothetical protein [Deltaproteobacteria bacterium]